MTDAESRTGTRVAALGVRRPSNVAGTVTYVVRRVAQGIVVLLLVSLLVYFLTDALPGDQVSLLLGRNVDPTDLAAARAELGLDRPFPIRYGEWLVQFLQGNFGESLASRSPVSEIIGRRLANTATLAGISAGIILVVSVIVGTWSAVRRDSAADTAVSGVALWLSATPEFLLGAVLTLALAVQIPLLPSIVNVPVDGWALSDPISIVLPVLTVSLGAIAYMLRMIRVSVIDTLNRDYVEIARLRGIPERTIITRHVLRNSLGPSIQVFALTLQFLLAGLIIVETIFAFPGIGVSLVNGVSTRDLPLVQAIVVILASVYVVINIVADLAVVAVDPRTRGNLS